MKYVHAMGGIWKLSNKSYKKLEKDIKSDKGVDLDDYGKQVITQFHDLEDIVENSYEDEE